MNRLTPWQEAEMARERNIIAAVSSMVPGLGHLYKGHYSTGFFLILLGLPMAIWTGILLSLATAGLGLIFPLFCWIGVGIDAYFAPDRRQPHPANIL